MKMNSAPNLLRLPLLLGALVLLALAWTGCAGSLEDPEEFTIQAEGGAREGSSAEAAPASSCPDVPTVFAQSCGTSGCHDATTKTEALDLVSPGLAERLVGVSAVEGVGLLIDPSTPSNSVLYTKLLSTPPFGARMPAVGSLDVNTIQCVLAWITSEVTPAPGDAGADDAGPQPVVDAGASPDAVARDGATSVVCSTLTSTSGSITDSTGHVWTLVVGPDGSLVVDLSGSAAGYSDHVVELIEVRGVIYQENSAGDWFSWTSGKWASASNPTAACTDVGSSSSRLSSPDGGQ